MYLTEQALAEKYGYHPSTVCRAVSRMRSLTCYQRRIIGTGKGTRVDEDAFADYQRRKKELKEPEGERWHDAYRRNKRISG